MKFDLKELAGLVKGNLIGDGDTLVTGVAGITDAQKGDITFLSHPKYADKIGLTKATAIVLNKPHPNCAIPMLIVEHPQYAFSLIISCFYDKPYFPKGINPKAVIGENVTLGKDLSIYPFATIGDHAKIGSRVTIYPGVFVGDYSEIGEDSILYPNVAIMERVSIGERVVIHSGTVIGSDGYGYIPYDGKHHKMPQVGEVIIEDDVEIGSNTSIDRASLGKTIVKRGTKIDNLVQIAHNVLIGEDCIIVSQVGISGSSEIGNNVTLAGKVGVVDHVKVGDNCLVGAGTGVYKNVEPNQQVFGNPFMPYGKFLRIQGLIVRLPEIKIQIRTHEERLKKLEKQLAKEEQKLK